MPAGFTTRLALIATKSRPDAVLTEGPPPSLFYFLQQVVADRRSAWKEVVITPVVVYAIGSIPERGMLSFRQAT